MERTDHQRVETSLAARISTDEGELIDCTIKDLSDNGAKLEVAAESVLPPDFSLKILQTGEILRAEVRWRYASKAGVRFVKQEELPEQEPTREALIVENRRLWETLETLATRLTQLGEHVALPVGLRRLPAASLTATDPAILSAREVSAMPLA